MCGFILECELKMGFVNKIFGEKKPGDVGGYIDLEKYNISQDKIVLIISSPEIRREASRTGL